MTMNLTNLSGSTFGFLFGVVRSDTVDGRMALAQADTAAHAAGLIGFSLSAPTNGALGIVIPANSPSWVQFTGAPTVGRTAYLSTATAGMAQDTIPASGGTVQIVALGTITRASGTLGFVVPAPLAGAAGAITALTGDGTATGPGSATLTIATGAVTNAKRANMAANTLSGNATGSPAAPTDLTAAAIKTLLAISFSDVSGTLLATQSPAFTGDTTKPAGSFATTLANLPQSVLLTRTAALTSAIPVNGQQITGLASGGATSTNAANIGDATSIATTAVTSGAVAKTGHTAESVLVSIAGTVSDLPLTASTLVGRAATGDVVAVPFSSVVAGAVATTGHTAESVLVSIAGTISDLPLTASTLVGRAATGDVVAIPFSSVVAGGGGGSGITALTGDVTGTGPGSTATTIASIPQTPLLTRMAALTASLAINSQRVTGAADPIAAQDLATKSYVDALMAGLRWKQPVVVTISSNGTLATAFANGQVQEGVTLSTGMRIALIGQTTGAENGLYTVNASGAPTRATDADSALELVSCAFFTQQGTINADKAFVCTNDTITIGTTNITFVPFASVLGALLAANNLSDLTNVVIARTNLGLAAIAVSGSATDLIAGTVPAARMPAHTGDATSTAGSVALTLAASGVVAGTYGDASHVAQVTVDAKGRETSASSIAIAIAAGAVSGLAAIATSGAAGDLVSGTVPVARLPRFTGGLITSPSAGSAVLDIADNTVPLAKLVTLGAGTLLGDSGSGNQIIVPTSPLVISGTFLNLDRTQARTFLGMDQPQLFEMGFSFGRGDGNNVDSVIPTSFGVGGAYSFWMPAGNMLTADITHGYVGADTDANAQFQNEWEWFPSSSGGPTFGHCEITVGCFWWDPQTTLPTPKINVIVTKNGSKDSSPSLVSITSTGDFRPGPVAYTFAPNDRIGVVVQPDLLIGNTGTFSARVKFTVRVRLTP